MKAKRYSDGNIINVVSYKGASEMWQNIQDENELYHTLELEFADSDMPSENRMRYELAKAAMQGMCAGNNRPIDSFRSKDIRHCIEIADKMIYQLKESEVEK